MVRYFVLALSLGWLWTANTPASATTWLINKSNGCSGGCTTGPFGSVTVTDNSAGTLYFNLQLFGTYQFMGGDNIFAFNLTGLPAVTFGGFIPSGWYRWRRAPLRFQQKRIRQVYLWAQCPRKRWQFSERPDAFFHRVSRAGWTSSTSLQAPTGTCSLHTSAPWPGVAME